MRLKERWANACAVVIITAPLTGIYLSAQAMEMPTDTGVVNTLGSESAAKTLFDSTTSIRFQKSVLYTSRDSKALLDVAIMPYTEKSPKDVPITTIAVHRIELDGQQLDKVKGNTVIITESPALDDMSIEESPVDNAPITPSIIKEAADDTTEESPKKPEVVAGAPLDLTQDLVKKETPTDPSLKTYFAGCGEHIMPYERFYAEHIKTDKMHTLVAGTLYNSGRILYPFAYTGAEVTKKSDISALQMLLVRMNAYPDQSKLHIDGQMGEQTRAAITKCQTALAKKYADIKIDGHADPVFLKALANEGAKDIFYREFLIREANTHDKRLNTLSYNVALAREIQGDYLGMRNPNYMLLDPKKEQAEIDIVARTLWGEAAIEGENGQRRVAENIMMRFIKGQLMPKTRKLFGWTSLSDVARHQTRKKGGYQYSLWFPSNPNYKTIIGLSEEKNDDFKISKEIAKAAFWGDIKMQTEGADHYHATYVNPAWKKDSRLTVKIGKHIFYNLYGMPKSYFDAQLVAAQINAVRPDNAPKPGEKKRPELTAKM